MAFIGWIITLAVGFVLSVLANIFTPHINSKLNLEERLRRIFRRSATSHESAEQYPQRTPSEPAPEVPPSANTSLEQQQENTAILAFWGRRLLVFGGTYYLLFTAIYVPLLLRSILPLHLGKGSPLDLSLTRLPLSGSIDGPNLLYISLTAALIAYFPCMFIANWFAEWFKALMLKFKPVDDSQYSKIILICSGFIAVVLAGHMSWLLFPSMSYLAALVAPFFVMALGYLWIEEQSTEQRR